MDNGYLPDPTCLPLIPNMISNSTDGITLTASSVNASSQDCFYACDGNDSTRWCDLSTSTSSTAWFKIAFSTSKKVKKMHFMGSGCGTSSTVKLQGSNDNSNFTDLMSRQSDKGTEFLMSKTGSYKYYRVLLEGISHNGTMGITPYIYTLQLYGE